MYLFPLDVKVIGEKPMLRAQASATTLELLPGEVRYATLRWYNEGSADCVGDWRLVVTAVVNSITHSLVLIAFTSGLALAIPSKPSLLESFMKTEIIRKPDGTNSDIWLALKIKLSYIPGLRSVSFDLEVISSSDIDHFRQSLLKDRTNPPEPIYAHKYVSLDLIYMFLLLSFTFVFVLSYFTEQIPHVN